MLTLVNGYPERHGLKIGTGTIVGTTILAAPLSTKNKHRKRDPEMPQVKQWHFSMKAHVGVDADTKLIHSAKKTAANVADNRVLPELLHGEETDMCATMPARARPRRFGNVRRRRPIGLRQQENGSIVDFASG